MDFVSDIKISRVKVRGFASMPKKRVLEIARLGGLARCEQLGHSGYVELGRKGGTKRSQQLTHQQYVKMGRKGGLRKKIRLRAE
jgi:general stress protein YciG